MKETNEENERIIKLLQEINLKFDNLKQPRMYYRNSDLKERFGLSDNTIISYRDKNILPFAKLGEIYYYPIGDIENRLSQNSNFDLFGNRC